MNLTRRAQLATAVAITAWGASGPAVAATPTSHNLGLVAHYCFEDADNLAKDCRGVDHGQVTGGALRAAGGWLRQGAYLEAAPGKTPSFTVPVSATTTFKNSLTFMLAVKPYPASRNVVMQKGEPKYGPDCYGVVPGGWEPPINGFAIDIQAVKTRTSTATGFAFGLGTSKPGCHHPSLVQPWAGFVDGRWTHVALTADTRTGQFNLYLNGVLQSPGSQYPFTAEILKAMNEAPLTIATGQTAVIDEVKVFRRALSADEVRAHALAIDLAQPIAASANGKNMADVWDVCLFGGPCLREDPRTALAGVDFSAPAGTEVRALCDGTIEHANPAEPVSERLVRIRHGAVNCGSVAGSWGYYGHVDIAEGLGNGSKVGKGQVIGTVANWIDAAGKDVSRLHLAVNSSQRAKRWRFVDTGGTPDWGCADEEGILANRLALSEMGWMDTADLAPANGWAPMLRIPICYGDSFPTDHLQPPYGTSLPYYPYEPRP